MTTRLGASGMRMRFCDLSIIVKYIRHYASFYRYFAPTTFLSNYKGTLRDEGSVHGLFSEIEIREMRERERKRKMNIVIRCLGNLTIQRPAKRRNLFSSMEASDETFRYTYFCKNYMRSR